MVTDMTLEELEAKLDAKTQRRRNDSLPRPGVDPQSTRRAAIDFRFFRTARDFRTLLPCTMEGTAQTRSLM
jgi:hypothetical protein